MATKPPNSNLLKISQFHVGKSLFPSSPNISQPNVFERPHLRSSPWRRAPCCSAHRGRPLCTCTSSWCPPGIWCYLLGWWWIRSMNLWWMMNDVCFFQQRPNHQGIHNQPKLKKTLSNKKRGILASKTRMNQTFRDFTMKNSYEKPA